MKIFLDDNEIEEIKPISESTDLAIIITPEVGKRGEGNSDFFKEIIALDTLVIGPTEASKIHGVPVSSASRYSNGKDIANEDIKSNIIAQKYKIEDTAVAKLMETLDMINPNGNLKIEQKRVSMANQLSQIVERVSGDSKNNSDKMVLHLHMPSQKHEKDYTVIDV